MLDINISKLLRTANTGQQKKVLQLMKIAQEFSACTEYYSKSDTFRQSKMQPMQSSQNAHPYYYVRLLKAQK